MKALRKLVALFLADRLVMVAVPVAAVLGWLAAPYVPHALIAAGLLALLAGAFSAGVLGAARKPGDS